MVDFGVINRNNNNSNKIKCQNDGNDTRHRTKGDIKLNSRKKSQTPSSSSSSSSSSLGDDHRPRSLISWPTILSKMMISILILFLFYLYQSNKSDRRNESMSTMASSHDDLMGSPIGMQIECPKNDYVQERNAFGTKCVPTTCGRFVSDSIVDDQEALEMRLMAETIFSQVQTPGGVAIFDVTTGALSNGTRFVNLYKLIQHHRVSATILRPKALQVFQTVRNKIINSISMQFGLVPDHIHLTSPAFFTRIDSTNHHRTLNDQYWHPHVDKETYQGFIYTSLLYLSSYNEEFFGGRFVFLDAQAKNNITVEPKFGRVLFFTSGSENQHMVEKLQTGQRFALTIPFTCDPNRAARIPNI